MNGIELNSTDDPLPSEARPRTGAVVGLLAGGALIISYLFAYCLVNALVAAEVISRWQPNHDPRPRFFLGAFVALLGSFSGFAFLARTVSRRQMSKIDAMESD